MLGIHKLNLMFIKGNACKEFYSDLPLRLPVGGAAEVKRGPMLGQSGVFSRQGLCKTKNIKSDDL